MNADDLPAKDLIGKSDPYFQLKQGDLVLYTSEVVTNCLNPFWIEFFMSSNEMDSKEFVLDVWDHDSGSADDWIGSVTFKLHASFVQGSKRFKETIKDKKGKSVGEMEINIKVYRISGKMTKFI